MERFQESRIFRKKAADGREKQEIRLVNALLCLENSFKAPTQESKCKKHNKVVGLVKTDEKIADKVARLAKELDVARQQIAACQHDYSAPVPATRIVHIPFFLRFEGHGSDPEPVYDWVPQTEQGWERTCGKCGYSQYTAKSRPIIAGYGPDFGK